VHAAPRAQQRLLHRVLRVVDRAQHPVAVGEEHGAMLLGDLAERVRVAGSSRVE